MVRIDNEKEYIECIESAVINAGRKIIKTKLHGAFIFLKYKDINTLSKKYFNGKRIRQASFHSETNLKSHEIQILNAMRVALNKNHVFVYEKDIVDKIKAKDLSIVSKFRKKPKYKIVGELTKKEKEK